MLKDKAINNPNIQLKQLQQNQSQAKPNHVHSPEMRPIGEELARLQQEMNLNIIGQEHLIRCLLITLITGGHILVEGAPGLAKTTAIRKLAEFTKCNFHRIQFTPDLLPSDIIGSDIYRPQTGVFEFYKGGIFNEIILADEINRSPAKVQSALLEAMEEKQVSVGQKTYKLPEIFMVMATQNPIEQEGTYPLPEAQLDRFLFKVNVSYPNSGIEKKILNFYLKEEKNIVSPSFIPLTQETILKSRNSFKGIYISESICEYIVQLVMATRKASHYDQELGPLIAYGASPRGTISLSIASRANALLNGRDFVRPDDVRQIIYDVLRHRILLSFEAQAQQITTDEIIDRLLDLVPIF